jgi:hypothetical protein
MDEGTKHNSFISVERVDGKAARGVNFASQAERLGAASTLSLRPQVVAVSEDVVSAVCGCKRSKFLQAFPGRL